MQGNHNRDFMILAPRAAAAEITRHLREGGPMSFIRLGDGEGLVLSLCDESSLDDLVRCPEDGDDCPVGVFARVYVEKPDALYAFDLVRDLIDPGQIPAFAEVRYALYESHRDYHSPCFDNGYLAICPQDKQAPPAGQAQR